MHEGNNSAGTSSGIQKTGDFPQEHSAIITKQLQAARDIQMLSGNELNENDAMLLASMYQSGYFKDVDSLSKAVTRSVFGKMIGIPIAVAISSLYIIDGKPGLEAKAIRNTLVLAGYTIHTKKLDNKECILEWFYKDKKLGESNFTMHDAIARGYIDPTCAKLPNFPDEHNDRELDRYDRKKRTYIKKLTCDCKDNWRAMPQEMLVARATSRGNTKYGNRAFKGEVYEVTELTESMFREDTTAVDVARTEIEGAKTIEDLEEATKLLDSETLTEVLPDIQAKSKELLSGANPKANNPPSPAKN